MKKFALAAKVKRVVIDTISIHVEAETELEAIGKATSALQVFPQPHDIEGIPYCYVENRENGPVDIIYIDEEEDKGVA